MTDIEIVDMLRERLKGLTPAEINKKSGVSKSTIRDLMLGYRWNYTITTVIALANAVGLTLRLEVDEDSDFEKKRIQWQKMVADYKQMGQKVESVL